MVGERRGEGWHWVLDEDVQSAMAGGAHLLHRIIRRNRHGSMLDLVGPVHDTSIVEVNGHEHGGGRHACNEFRRCICGRARGLERLSHDVTLGSENSDVAASSGSWR